MSEYKQYQYKPVAKPFFDALDEGKFLGLQCKECGRVEFPPYPVCGNCGDFEHMKWVEMSGKATIKEIYSVSPMMTIEEFMPYAPIYTAEVQLAEGPEISCMIFGVNRKNYEEMRDSVPMEGNLVVMPMEGYNSFAVAINGAVPKRKESRAKVMNQEELIGTMAQKNDTPKNDHPMTGEYDLVGKILGRSQDAKMNLLVDDKNQMHGAMEIMDEQVPIESGTVNGEDFEMVIVLRGTEVPVKGTIKSGHLKGTAKITGIKLKLEGDKR